MKATDFHKFQQSGENVCVEFKRGHWEVVKK